MLVVGGTGRGTPVDCLSTVSGAVARYTTETAMNFLPLLRRSEQGGPEHGVNIGTSEWFVSYSV